MSQGLGFLIGLGIGAAVSGAFVFWHGSKAVEAAEARTKALEDRSMEKMKEGSDERLELLDPIPAGNGTAYLYDNTRGKVWIVTADGIRLVQGPKQ